MRGGLFLERSSDRSIFAEESILYPEHLPDILPHREGQISYLADCIRPVASGSKPTNVFVHGPPGVGKTAVTKFILRELKEGTDVIPAYLNCWQRDTRHAILTQLAYKMGAFAPRRGTATDEIYSTFVEGAKRSKRNMVVVLDEVDKLLIKDGSQAIYDLLRGEFQNQVGLVLISNDEYALRRLDDRTRSSLSAQEIEYLPYNFEELKDILGKRVEFAFVPDSVEAGVVTAVSRYVAENGGDVRLGLECLLRAGQLADVRGNKLKVEHVHAIFKKIQGSKLKEMLGNIGDEHKLLLKALARLREKGDVKTGELMAAYRAAGGKAADRTFRKYINDLESLGFLRTEKTGKGFRGKSKIIDLKFEPSRVLSILEGTS